MDPVLARADSAPTLTRADSALPLTLSLSKGELRAVDHALTLSLSKGELDAGRAAFALLPLPRGGDADGMCIIEPSVRCTHCGYCQTYGH
ncbi:MAG TPA: hypothetical protein VFA27_15750 [Vicinamibacterales bacterium]|nr:hypothetical protein [Vicinamibacterales bacterium]